jgi:NAD(P)-dependent dehydrogenase (short-subunit alcohol dehydrogenase family)
MSNDRMHPLKCQVALVTGAARGIGLAIATRLARDGADLVAFDLPSAVFEECQVAVQAAGSRCVSITGDVVQRADWQRAVTAAQETFGRLDILVNNAGIAGVVSSIIEYPEEQFDRVMAVNTRSVFLGMKYAASAMREHGGTIINIASVSGLSGSRFILPYTASKHAVIGMTKAAALEFAHYGIRVNAICPAPTATEMMFNLERTQSPDNPEAVRQRFAASIPLGRYGQPSEIAAVAAFLASTEASFMTGAAVTVDGGMLAS